MEKWREKRRGGEQKKRRRKGEEERRKGERSREEGGMEDERGGGRHETMVLQTAMKVIYHRYTAVPLCLSSVISRSDQIKSGMKFPFFSFRACHMFTT